MITKYFETTTTKWFSIFVIGCSLVILNWIFECRDFYEIETTSILSMILITRNEMSKYIPLNLQALSGELT